MVGSQVHEFPIAFLANIDAVTAPGRRSGGGIDCSLMGCHGPDKSAVGIKNEDRTGVAVVGDVNESGRVNGDPMGRTSVVVSGWEAVVSPIVVALIDILAGTDPSPALAGFVGCVKEQGKGA